MTKNEQLLAIAAGLAILAGYFTYIQTPQEIVTTIENTMINENDPTLPTNNNLEAFLTLIRTGEGTLGDGGYSTLFGGGHFVNGYLDHPRTLVKANGYSSTAAGAYQILAKTWDDLRSHGVDLPDFTPEMQDRAAIALIKRRGALQDVLDGNFTAAITKTNKEWASLPNSPYGQPTLTMARAFDILAQNNANVVA